MEIAETVKKALMEMDDAELGREVKKNVDRFCDAGGNISFHIVLASRVLVACLDAVKGNSLEQPMKNQEINGKPIGNFIIKVEKGES